MRKETILVVDDDVNHRWLCAVSLVDEGYDVIVAKSGKAALKIVEDNTPDLVVLDIVMPEMDGIEAMLRILRKHGKIPLILHTSYSRYREEFITWAADGYVVKSSDFIELKTKINELLSTPRGDAEKLKPS